ncbi:MAG: hypothetical protein A2231_12575 [Candidatus Firestonebacteria bacterium RIFOXYA2_FULL_40_8]|nr:MAG: hypothetical protein A2231_12575 [Candidatus Firestonebacteria bacterium RIFOXYA2_FULL_40_8]
MQTEGKIQSTPRIYLQTALTIMRSPFFLIVCTLMIISFIFISPKEILMAFATRVLLFFSNLPGIVVTGLTSNELMVVMVLVAISLSYYSLHIEKPRTLLIIGIANTLIGADIFFVRLTLWAFLPFALSFYPLLKYANFDEFGAINKKIGIKQQIPLTILVLIILFDLAVYSCLPGKIFYTKNTKVENVTRVNTNK